MKKVLITGFQPFGGESINPALEAVKILDGEVINGYQVVTCELPVVRFDSINQLKKHIDKVNPDAVITVGQAGGRPDITIERIGINIDDYRIPDNAGNQPIDQIIEADGPIAYWATLPIKRMVHAIKQAGVAASVSNSAGTYVCNHLLYSLLHYLKQTNRAHIPAGFVHIPYLPEQMAVRFGGDSQAPTMSLDTLKKGFTAMIAALAPSEVKQITPNEAKAIVESKKPYIIVDVRSAEEFAEGHIEGAIHISHDTIEEASQEKLQDITKHILLYCHSGGRSQEAAEKLVQLGYASVYNFGGVSNEDWTFELVK